MRNIYTIGHSTRNINDFIQILLDNKIKYLIDVRSYPGSKKFPQYNKKSLSNSLKKYGIVYVLLPLLGGRRSGKLSYDSEIRVKTFASYAEYMLSKEFRQGMIDLLKISQKYRSVVMCSEILWWKCHRRMIADQLELWGYKVFHLGMDNKVIRHDIWNLARLDSKGRVIYDLE